MKMNKILLSVALLVSVSAFAMEKTVEVVTPTVQTVKTSIGARAKAAVSNMLTNGYGKVKHAWENRPSMPESVKTKLASCSTWTAGKWQTMSTWFANHIPAPVKTFVTNPRNLKIAGAVAAVVAAATGSYFAVRKLFAAKPVIVTTK